MVCVMFSMAVMMQKVHQRAGEQEQIRSSEKSLPPLHFPYGHSRCRTRI